MLSWEQAKRLVQDVEDAFGAADLERIAQGFTEDAVARFADFPEMRGRPAIMSFLGARFARTRGYRLKKTLHVLMDDRLANTWDASWEDARRASRWSAEAPRSGSLFCAHVAESYGVAAGLMDIGEQSRAGRP